jgi:hypothetical protein
MTPRRQLTVNIIAALLIATTLSAQNFWEKKDYRQWTEQEVSRLTTDSPWSKTLNNLTITWLTALPIKQALLKERMEAGGILAESAQDIMGIDDQYYVIGITGLPADMSEKLTEVWLKLPGKPEIDPANATFQPRGRTVDVMILFPRTSPITIGDNEVEVVLKLESAEIGKKFPLKDMVYAGKLEL